jgi:type I restriction enzyme, S subunit
MTCPKWPVVRLGEIAEFRNGINYNKDNFGTGLKVINVKDFQDHLIADLSDLDEINPDGVVRDECLLKDGDIIFVRSNGNRDLIGRSMLIRGITEPISHSAFSIKTRFHSKDVLPRFYAYLFRSALIRSELSNRGGGTNISNLSQDILNSLEVPKPSFVVQHKLSSLLSAYDDLIENNTRRIAILEAMAQAIYREWFVEFRFPGHEKVRFVDSPLGTIPERWEVQTLNDVCKGIIDSEHKTAPTQNDGFPCIRTPNIEKGHFSLKTVWRVSNDTYLQWTRRAIPQEGDLILAREAPVGNVAIIPSRIKPCLGQRTVLIKARREILSSHYLLRILLSDYCQCVFSSVSSGVTVAHLNLSDIRAMRILVAERPIRDCISPCFEMIDKQVACLLHRNQILIRTRDLLLPKLLSGQLDVEDLDIEIGEGVTATA